jgi:hypothetical protein
MVAISLPLAIPGLAVRSRFDGARCKLTGIEMRPIAQHYNSVESQARFRTIPVNEFIDGVRITPLRVQAGEAIQDSALACSRSGRRRTDFVVVRFLREQGFRFMIDGLRATDQDWVNVAAVRSEWSVIQP